MTRRFSGRRAGRVSSAVRTAFAVAALGTALFTPRGARAQDALSTQAVASDSATAAPAAAPIGPTLAGARAGAARAESAVAAEAAAPVRGPGAGRPVALMAVGGAAIVLGAIIGGDGGKAVSIGGVIVGAIGLYEFLR